MSDAKPSILVVDDELIILEAWQEILGGSYDLHLFSDPLAAQRHFTLHDVDVAIMDVRMPGMDGLSLLQSLRKVQPRAEVLMVTGNGTIEMAVQAIKVGAYDFLCKPIDDLEAATRRVAAAVERKRLRELNANLSARLEAFGPETQLVGESRALNRVREMIDQVANSPAPVLICGESGTGKELVARAVHSRSNRSDKPFIAVNCAAMSESLIDSELFGHERGAFTGAITSHKGLFEAADGGVLFLDEIGDVPLQTQVRLLRALQEGEIRPVGSTKSRKVDVRLVAATNSDLERSMREGTFREDLFYRISTFRVELPPLRLRREDIPVISHHLVRKYGQRTGQTTPTFTDEAMTALVANDWPGNVRELNNAIEHAATLATGNRIEVEHLPGFVHNTSGGRARVQSVSGSVGSIASGTYTAARNQLLDDFEQRYLADLLVVTAGNLSEASRRSGIDRSNLRRMLRRHSIKATGFKE